MTWVSELPSGVSASRWVSILFELAYHGQYVMRKNVAAAETSTETNVQLMATRDALMAANAKAQGRAAKRPLEPIVMFVMR